MTKKTVSYFYS